MDWIVSRNLSTDGMERFKALNLNGVEFHAFEVFGECNYSCENKIHFLGKATAAPFALISLPVVKLSPTMSRLVLAGKPFSQETLSIFVMVTLKRFFSWKRLLSQWELR